MNLPRTTTTSTTAEGGSTSNSHTILSALAEEINDNEASRRACEVKGLMHGLRVGQLLLEAKKVISHGAFRDWLIANTSVSARMSRSYMRIAKSPEIQHLVEHEYETVSHLTLTQAVKLARQPKAREDKAREKMCRRISLKWEAHKEIRQSYIRCLGEVRQSFIDDGGGAADFKSWLVENAGVGTAFAEKIPSLLDEQADDDAWTDAMLADVVAQLQESAA